MATLINGDVFWSSVDLNEPLVIKPSQLIKGCQKVIPLMQVGDKWRVFIHPALGIRGRRQAWDTFKFTINI